jgi:predicted nucleic acid-binding protein
VLVLDASIAIRACVGGGFERFEDQVLVAPPVMWPEFRSSLHEAVWRREIPASDALEALERLEHSPVRKKAPRNLGKEAWKIADELGWAKTYDAEYLALGRLLKVKVVTGDLRLRRGADRLGLVVTPEELFGR